MIAIIDFGAGNLYSAYHAFKSFYAETKIVRSPSEICTGIRGLVLPGDGSFPAAFDCLKKSKFSQFIKNNVQIPMLGICVGFQLLFNSSDEDGGSEGLALIDGEIKKFVSEKEKIPHIGWNNCHFNRDSPLWIGVPNSSFFYFVHSHFAIHENSRAHSSVMTCHYINDFIAAVEKEKIYGCQFHPEKSHVMGWKIIENFVNICRGFDTLNP